MTTENNNVTPLIRREYLEGQLQQLRRSLKAKGTREDDVPKIQKAMEDILNELATIPTSEHSTEEDYEKALEKVTEFLMENLNERLYFIAEDNKFARYLPQALQWKFITGEGLRGSSAKVRSPLRFQILQEVLEKSQRAFTTKCYDDPLKGSVPGETLNMMLSDHWLKPIAGRTENSKWFDYLLFSVGNYKEENIKHLMQLIGWKYLHPGEWNMPAICLYGRGGSGKNLLGATLMSIIFGQHQVLVTGFKKLERFDGVLAGNMVVVFDEHPNKEDQSTLKAIVGNPTLEVELKNLNTFKIVNLALYFLFSNDANGPIKIENNGSERRWSMISSSQDLVSVIAKEEGISKEEAFARLKWADKNVYRNPDEVARFLAACVEEAQKLDAVPMALHGEDFKALKETQKDATDEILEEIFIEYKGFKFITLQTLYEIYKERGKELNPGASPMSCQRFNGRVIEFLTSNESAKHIVRTEQRYVVKVGYKQVKASVFYNSNVMESFDNRQTEDTMTFTSRAYIASTPQQASVQKLTSALSKIVVYEDDGDVSAYHSRLREEAAKQHEEWKNS